MDYEAELRTIMADLGGFEPVGAWQLPSVEATIGLGRAIGGAVAQGAMVALVGSMGAGKTHFVKGLAAARCGTDPHLVRSPTFTLLHTYRGRDRAVHHMDLCRIGAATEIPSDVSDAVEDPAAISAVEWADLFPDIWPERTVVVWLGYGAGEDERVANVWVRGGGQARLSAAIAGLGLNAA